MCVLVEYKNSIWHNFPAGFAYSDGTPVNYLYWAQGQPTDNNDATLESQDCVVVGTRPAVHYMSYTNITYLYLCSFF